MFVYTFRINCAETVMQYLNSFVLEVMSISLQLMYMCAVVW